MTEPCRTKCGTEIDYVREEFSDRVFFSIPTETDGTIHECVNLELAELDLLWEGNAEIRDEMKIGDFLNKKLDNLKEEK